MPRPTQDGLGWQQTLFCLVPVWTRDPSTGAIESVSRQQLKTPSEDPCTGTAVPDWDCVSALPLWMLTKMPKFLDGQPREDEPQRISYRDETPEEAAAEADKRNDLHYLDNEGKNELFWIHKMEYEKTQLRKVYRARLKELCLEWAEESPLKSDFYEAVEQCDGLWLSKARRWAERMDKGESVRFKDV